MKYSRMIRYLLMSLLVILLVTGCSRSDIPSQFVDDRTHLSEAFSAFNEANKLTQVPQGMVSYEPPPGVNEKIDALLAKGLKEGDAVSNEFLDWLHPEMKKHFRDEYMKGQRLFTEGVRGGSILKQVAGNELIKQWYEGFWNVAFQRKVDRFRG